MLEPLSSELPTVLGWPLQGKYWPTQEFGERKVDYSRFGLIGHNGLDLSAAAGTPVLAAHDGQVWAYTDAGGYGNTIEIWTPGRFKGATFKTIYAHLQSFSVQDYAWVREGQIIGFVGSTGNSTGAHLHFGVKLLFGQNPGYRDWIDPRPFLPIRARGK